MSESSPASETVVLLHGVWRSAWSMRPLERALRGAGYNVINETYPSVRRDILENSERLARRLQTVRAGRIHFVTHSMGGLVVRQMLANHPLPNLGRVVMIAPPSRGARLADRYFRVPFFRWVMGRGAMQLCTGEDALAAQLPPPPCDFAIFAGMRGHPRGWHPLIPGDDDGTVGVTEAYLPGASAFVTVVASHTFIMNNPRVIRGTIEFLETGRIEMVAAEGE
jgi:triacylglycerol lipase